MGRLVLPRGAAVFLLGGWMALGQGGAAEGVQIQIIYFNLETVQVTWNASKYSRTNLTFHYRFDGDEAYDQCTNYLLQEGHTSGCLLDAEQRDDILYFSIRNGTHPVFTASRWMVYYLKPSSPKHVRFSWHQDAVTVTCSDLSYGDLLYEVQYRSPFDTEWQSKQENTCNVTIEGLDAEKCYSFWVRVKAMEDVYGPDTYPSDWSEVTCWQRGEIQDACAETPTPPKPKLSKFILISSLAILLMVSLLLLSLWKLWRMKKFLMPSVPDPKSIFPGLFEIHQGNFQEWITDTQNVAHLHKMAGAEQESGPEEPLVVQLAKTEAESPRMLDPQTEEKEASGGSLQLPHQPLQGGDVVTIGGFTFVMNDCSYVAL
ncbi:CRLF2 isoform 3 [Pan troglodytes]|uniref:Cytokine receptor-like factor 2 n=1 Tax=Pan troglodytes TaxID=9598 RepID=A0A2J8IQ29_PANTR|nr:cytokine receptor-like factor 2 isoform X2 [Pan troglodytes]PNI12630.1 CRLF2 isoform 1 [Pan troglodytes]PNI12632.1 CRLF2 isoform 3 [Pan troglodytes]